MHARQWHASRWLPGLVLLGLVAAAFARLVVNPSALIVDGVRPSVDHANLGDPRPVGNDLTFLFLPHHLSIIKTMSRYGHLPMWDTRGFGGRPMVGNPQAGLFYPPTWAVWFSGAPAAAGWLTVAHLLWGGFGVYVLVRATHQSRWSSTVAAGVYEASPLLLAHTFEGHYPHVWSACWYPWAFWAYLELRSGRLRGSLVSPAVLAMSYLTGHPQEWYFLVLALSVWTLADVVRLVATQGWRPAASRCVVWTGIMAVSLGLAAVDIAPQSAVRPWLLGTRVSHRGIEIPSRYHLRPLNLLQLPSPFALGGPSDYFGGDNYWETVFSIGFVPLALVLVAIVRNPDRQVVRAWLWLLGIAVWFACGRQLGLFTLLYKTLPGMASFRVPARSLFLANLAAAVLAGIGVETLRSVIIVPDQWRTLRKRAIGAVVILLLGAGWVHAGQGILELSRTGRAITEVFENTCFWFAVTGAMALIWLGSLPPHCRNQRLAGSLLGFLALVEVGWLGFSLLRVAPAEQFMSPGKIVQVFRTLSRPGSGGVSPRDDGKLELTEFEAWIGDAGFCFAPAVRPPIEKGGQGGLTAHGQYLGPMPQFRVEQPSQNRGPAGGYAGIPPLPPLLKGGTTRKGLEMKTKPVQGQLFTNPASPSLGPPIRIKARDNSFSDLGATLLDIEKTNVNDVFQLDHAALLYQSLYQVASRPRPFLRLIPANEHVEEFNRHVRQAVFDRMSVSYLVSDRVESDPPWPVAAEGNSDGVTFVIQRNPTALPRAYVVPHAKVDNGPPEATLSLIRATDPRTAVLMTEDPLARIPSGPRQVFQPAHWTSLDPERPVIEVTTTAPGLLVVADTWMLGWTARVDGVPVPILRGNHAQCVIPLSQTGRHTIVMDYWPPGFTAGCIITVVTAIGWMIFVGFAGVNGKRTSQLTIEQQTRDARQDPFGSVQR